MVEFINNENSRLTGVRSNPLGTAHLPPSGFGNRRPTVGLVYRPTTYWLTRGIMDLRIEEGHIVEAVLQGDVEEFRVLVERYQAPIYHLMLRITHTTMTAEDLTQDVFERAYAKLHTYNTGKRFFPWIYTIAVNAGRDYLRKKGVRQDVFNADSEIGELTDTETDNCVKHLDCVMEAGRVSDAVDRLPLKYSEPLYLYYREGFTVKEIAAALGISAPSVKIRVHRGREKLKTALGVNDVKSG